MKFPALLGQSLFFVQPWSFNVASDEMSTRWCYEKHCLSVRRGRIDIGRSSTRRPGKTAHTLKEKRAQSPLIHKPLNASVLLFKF